MASTCTFTTSKQAHPHGFHQICRQTTYMSNSIPLTFLACEPMQQHRPEEDRCWKNLDDPEVQDAVCAYTLHLASAVLAIIMSHLPDWDSSGLKLPCPAVVKTISTFEKSCAYWAGQAKWRAAADHCWLPGAGMLLLSLELHQVLYRVFTVACIYYAWQPSLLWRSLETSCLAFKAISKAHKA